MSFSNSQSAQPVAASAGLGSRELSYQELDILHSLRGFCAFYVVVFHAKYILWSGGREYLIAFPRATWNIGQYFAFALDMMSTAGYEMVIFFFVLSGFFIRYAQRRKHRAPVAFYLNRIVRIYPPYLVSVVLAVSVLALIGYYVPQVLTNAGHHEFNTALLNAWHDLQNFKLTTLARTMIFLPAQDRLFLGYNTVYWSLLPEALFYCLVPLAFWRIRAYYVLSIVFYLVYALCVATHADANALLTSLFAYNFYFAIGVALYDAVVDWNWLAWFRRVSTLVLLVLLGLLFGLLLVLSLLKLVFFSGLTAALMAIVAISVLLAGKISQHNKGLRVFHWLGIFSFSLYLYHYPLLVLCNGLLAAATGQLTWYAHYYWLALPLVTLVCYGLYWCTERASVNYFRRI